MFIKDLIEEFDWAVKFIGIKDFTDFFYFLH